MKTSKTKTSSNNPSKATIQNMIHVCLNTPGANGMTGLPLVVWGPPGVAKSSIIEQVCMVNNLACEKMILALREPTDVTGWPVVREDDISFRPPAEVRRLINKGSGVLFLDELSCAAPSVQHAAMRIVLERVVGDIPLPPAVRVLAAANPASDVSGYELVAPLANRFVHITWSGPTAGDWADYVCSGKDSWEPPEPVLDWLTAYSQALGLVVGFVGPHGPRPDALLLGRRGESETSFPTPRSWEMTARIIGGCMVYDVDRFQLLSGCIGEGITREFETYCQYSDLPQPGKLLLGEEGFTHDPKRLDRTLAMLTAISTYILNFKEEGVQRMSMIDNAWKTMAGIKEIDLVIPPARRLVKNKLFGGKFSAKVMTELGPYLKR